jgi:hypothetical protein
MEIDITEGVQAFRDVVSHCWETIAKLAENDNTGSFVDDWLEANWEMIVEAFIDPSLRDVLETYVEGADCNWGSSRVWRPEFSPTTPVYVKYIGNEALVELVEGRPVSGEMVMSHFCTMIGGWPEVANPFDCVALEVPQMTTISATNLLYYVRTS